MKFGTKGKIIIKPFSIPDDMIENWKKAERRRKEMENLSDEGYKEWEKAHNNPL